MKRSILKTAAILIIGAGLYPAQAVFAISSSAGTQAGSFMKLGIGSPKAQALGHAYAALAEGPDALVWNPAGVGMTKQREMYFTYLKWVQDYGGYYFGYVHPVGQTVIGVNAAYMTVDGFDARDVNNIPQPNDEVTVRNDFITLTLARSFFVESFSVGASLKRVSEDNAGTEYANMVFDVGAQLHFGNLLHLGGAMMNMGNKDEVVQVSRVGAALSLGSYLTVSGELENPSDNRVRPGLGVEILIPEETTEVGRLSFRFGYYDSDDHGKNYDSSFLDRFNLSKTSKLSFGVGVYTSQLLGYGVGIDYAFTPFGALGTVNQLGLRFVF
ncbi:MAG: hypothetical protein PHW69_02595 [Elusimicrobiaceae bacterium]|nr:hypothetical protein [Elusimicrobiaceae bacterium]